MTLRRRHWLPLGALALGIVGFIAATNVGDPASDQRRHRPAPTFRIERVDRGGELDLRSYRGKPVVLNFWATWCVPCREEMPDLQAAHAAVGSRVSFVGINNRDSRRVALELLRETGVTYPSGFDPDGQLAAAYEVVGMPTTVFIDANGTIVSQHTGALNERGLRRRIKELFGVG